MILLVLTITVLAVTQACPPCDTGTCPQDPNRDCPLGPAVDPCECCSQGVCGLTEGRPCYNATVHQKLPALRRLGVCASNLLCVLRVDIGPSDRLEAVCSCADRRIACGSDNKTYESTCRMYRVENNKRVTLQHWGPCHQAPQVASGPEDTVLKQGQPLQLSCEAKGYPVPSITWEFVASDGTLTVLPADNPSVSIQLRGGPESFMVSSWVQVLQVQQTESGTYTCVASNGSGSARAMAQVTVKTS